MARIGRFNCMHEPETDVLHRLLTNASLQVEDFLEKSTREERQGLAFDAIPDADLFYVDKVG